MHRCSSSQGSILGPCTCDLFHNSQSNSFSSMLFSNHKHFDETNMYSNFTSSVDCTLSLGTPSTRLSNEDDDYHHEKQPSSRISNFCWDILQSKHTTPPSHKASRGGGNGSSNNNNTACDPLVARRCANCDTTSTPLWRNGPRGPKSLCNACGIRFKKEERRAGAAANTTTTTTTNSAAAGAVMEAQQMINQYNNPWAVHQSQKIPCISPGNEFRFTEDYAADTGIPFLSWRRLNVTDRPSLVHDFTR